jgi:hypothetical protein
MRPNADADSAPPLSFSAGGSQMRCACQGRGNRPNGLAAIGALSRDGSTAMAQPRSVPMSEECVPSSSQAQVRSVSRRAGTSLAGSTRCPTEPLNRTQVDVGMNRARSAGGAQHYQQGPLPDVTTTILLT